MVPGLIGPIILVLGLVVLFGTLFVFWIGERRHREKHPDAPYHGRLVWRVFAVIVLLSLIKAAASFVAAFVR